MEGDHSGREGTEGVRYIIVEDIKGKDWGRNIIVEVKEGKGGEISWVGKEEGTS